MGLLARGGAEEDLPPSNPRAAGGPPEGTPGETITVMLDVLPPVVIFATVEDDGWFADEVYEQIAAAKAEAKGGR